MVIIYTINSGIEILLFIYIIRDKIQTTGTKNVQGLWNNFNYGVI